MKRLFVITVSCILVIHASGQVLTEISTEAGKLCKELTSVNQGIGRIQGILNNISDCTSDLRQVSNKSNKLSITKLSGVQPATRPQSTTSGGALTTGSSERVKGIVEVKNEMQAINNRLVRLNDKLVQEEKSINQSLIFIKNSFGKIKGKLTASSPEYKCISEQLTSVNTIAGVLQKRAESFYKEANQVLGSFQEKTDCNELIGENCDLISCINCCDKQYSGSKAGSDPEEVAVNEFSRQACRNKCTFAVTTCILKKVTNNTRDALGNMRP